MSVKSEPQDPVLTVSQVAEKLHLSEYTIRDMLKRGELQGIKVRFARKWLIRESAVEVLLLAWTEAAKEIENV